MKRFILIPLLVVLVLSVTGQTQSGYVRTAGRPDNKEGKRIPGVEIRFRGKHNAVVCNKKGVFTVNFGGGETSYVINSVSREGYELQEKELLGRREPVSESIPKEIVMISLKEKKMIEDKVRRQVETKYKKKLETLQKQLKDKSITEEKYKEEIKRLNDEYDIRDRLVQDMVERYANTDYAKLSDKEIEINTYIENGELEKADSVINGFNISKLEQDRASLLQDINAKERQVQAGRAAVQSIDSTLWTAYRGKADLFFADFQSDSSVYYLEKLLTLEPDNVELLIEIGAYYDNYLADRSKSLYYLKKAKELLGHDSTSVLMTICVSNMALCYLDFVMLDSAKICWDEALRLARQQGDKPREALALSNMSAYYSVLADRENQKRCLDESLSIYKSVYGEKNEYVVSAYNKLGSYYLSMSDYQKAIEYSKKALNLMPITKDVYAAVSACYNNIGNAYQNLGILDSAEYYYNKSRDLSIRIYGERHPDVALVLGNLSTLYNTLGDVKKAMDLRKEALSIDIDFYVDYHLDIATDYANLSTLYGNVNKYDSCLQYAFEALRIFIAIDSLHPDMIMTYSNIGNAYTYLGQLNTALDYYIKASDIANRYPDENKGNVASLYLGIGNLFNGAGMYEKALAYYEESLKVLNEIYSEENFNYFVLLHNMGVLYGSSGDPEKAIKYYNRAEKLLVSSKLTESMYAAQNATSLGVALNKLEKYDSAAIYVKRGYRLYAKILGDTSMELDPIINNVIQNYYDAEAYDSALVYAWKQYDLFVSHSLYDAQHFWGACTIINMILHKLGRMDECTRFMEDKSFVADVQPEGELVSRGYSGTYYVLEWKEWNVNDSLCFAEAYGAPIKPYNVTLYRNGQIYREVLDEKPGAILHMAIIGSKAKQEILGVYNK